MLSAQPNRDPFAVIPEELRGLRQWVVHERKVPLTPETGKAASTADALSWGTFAQARARAARFGQGIGFVFSDTDPFVGIDLDRVREPGTGELSSLAAELLETFGSYTEVSPSGRGLHIIVRAPGLEFPGGSYRFHGERLELYRTRRFFCMTGRLVLGGGASPKIEDGRDALRAVLLGCEVQQGREAHQGGPRFKANRAVVEALFGELGIDVSSGKALCPFHDDTSPSLFVNENGYRCFSAYCELGGGGAVKLRRKIARLSDLELASVSQRTGTSVEHLVRVRDELRAALKASRDSQKMGVDTARTSRNEREGPI